MEGILRTLPAARSKRTMKRPPKAGSVIAAKGTEPIVVARMVYVDAYARIYGKEMVDIQVAIARNVDAGDSTRLLAAEKVLNRGFGTPTVSVQIADAGLSNMTSDMMTKRINELMGLGTVNANITSSKFDGISAEGIDSAGDRAEFEDIPEKD